MHVTPSRKTRRPHHPVTHPDLERGLLSSPSLKSLSAVSDLWWAPNAKNRDHSGDTKIMGQHQVPSYRFLFEIWRARREYPAKQIQRLALTSLPLLCRTKIASLASYSQNRTRRLRNGVKAEHGIWLAQISVTKKVKVLAAQSNKPQVTMNAITSMCDM